MIKRESNSIERKKRFLQFYQDVFPKLAAFISKRGGSFEDAKDIFQDALIIHYERADTSKELSTSNAYLFGIARHLWYKKYGEGHDRVTTTLDHIPDGIQENKLTYVSLPKMTSLLQKAGQKCMRLLQAVYYDKMSMREVSHAFGYTSERSATVQKFKCMEKIRAFVKRKNMSYENFIE